MIRVEGVPGRNGYEVALERGAGGGGGRLGLEAVWCGGANGGGTRGHDVADVDGSLAAGE
jgi:hypothetical protein